MAIFAGTSFTLGLAFIGCVLAKPLPSEVSHRGPQLTLRPIPQAPLAASSYIVGGGPADHGDSLYTVALVTPSRGRLFQFCGGTLISPKFIVTAAHCVEAGYTMQAVVGRYTLSDGGVGETIDVAESFVHPAYNPETMSGDIALLRLAHPVSIDVPFMELITPEAAQDVTPGSNVTVLGWGLTAEQGQSHHVTKGNNNGPVAASGSNELKAVTLPVVSNAICNDEYKAVTHRDQILAEQVCAAAAGGGLDSCQGDSGGPLIATVDDKQYLFGVVSWGIGCARPDIPGVYTRVSYHVDWLASKMMLEVTLTSGRGLGSTNILFTGTDKTAELSLEFLSMATQAITLDLGFDPVTASPSWSMEPTSLTLPEKDDKETATIVYQSTRAAVEKTSLVVGVNREGKDVTSMDFGLTAFALPPADFGGLIGWYTGGDRANKWVSDAAGLNSGITDHTGTAVALYYFKGAGQLRFKWRASTEEGYDVLYFFLDNEPVDVITGETDWESKSYLVSGPADKQHTAAWVYVKDKSVSGGDDKGYVSDVSFGVNAAKIGMKNIFGPTSTLPTSVQKIAVVDQEEKKAVVKKVVEGKKAAAVPAVVGPEKANKGDNKIRSLRGKQE